MKTEQEKRNNKIRKERNKRKKGKKKEREKEREKGRLSVRVFIKGENSRKEKHIHSFASKKIYVRKKYVKRE